MKLFDTLRQRSEEERLMFSALFAGFVALILFLIWGTAFFSGSATSVKSQTKAQTADAFSSIDTKREFSNVVNAFSGQYAQLRDVLESTQFSDVPQQTNVVDVSVDNTGAVQVQNVMVGPTLK